MIVFIFLFCNVFFHFLTTHIILQDYILKILFTTEKDFAHGPLYFWHSPKSSSEKDFIPIDRKQPLNGGFHDWKGNNLKIILAGESEISK